MNRSSGPVTERREFFRLDHESPLHFRQILDANLPYQPGTSINISPCGILFSTRVLPPLSCILCIRVDLRTLTICKEIEREVVCTEEGLLGRVVRVEEDGSRGGYLVGVCFLKKADLSTAHDLGHGLF